MQTSTKQKQGIDIEIVLSKVEKAGFWISLQQKRNLVFSKDCSYASLTIDSKKEEKKRRKNEIGGGYDTEYDKKLHPIFVTVI